MIPTNDLNLLIYFPNCNISIYNFQVKLYSKKVYVVNFRLFPNCIVKTKTDRKRVFVADEVEECRDHSSIFFLTPAEKGYIG